MGNLTDTTPHKDQAISLSPGTIVAGRYEIIQCLGFGSVGVVYSCFHRDLPERQFAIKFLHSTTKDNDADGGSLMGRFRNELMAAYQVNHPNVVRAYDYIEENGTVAFTMEHVSGGDLWTKIKNFQSLSFNAIVDILSQICSGVQAIHEVGIVHRDLKPENILLSTDGTLKISDFGIARIRNGKHFTAHGGVVGTFDYMSPEYLKDSVCDERSDIFSIGILGYLLLTGESPFSNKSLVESIMSRIDFNVEPPDKLNPKCPHTLSTVILKALQPDPSNRYQSAGEMLYHLSALRFAMHREATGRAETVSLSSSEVKAIVGAVQASNEDQPLLHEISEGTRAYLGTNKSSLPDSAIGSHLGRTRGRRALSIVAAFCLAGFIVVLGSPVANDKVFPAMAGWIIANFPGLNSSDVYETDLTEPVEKDEALQRKATLLYKFVNHFSSRGAESSEKAESVTICILGADPFGSYIDRITSRARTVRNQHYRIVRIPNFSEVSPKTFKECTLAYVTQNDERDFQGAIDALGRSNVLVITDGTGTGVVDFVRDARGKVNFHVDQELARQRGIEIGPSLVQIASSYQSDLEEGRAKREAPLPRP